MGDKIYILKNGMIKVLKYNRLNGDGNFYQFDELKENYGIHGTFLDYQSILRKLPTYWKTKIN